MNINDVYKTVQAILNKEQRGYVSPFDFNKFAEQAQLEIFEGYFYDKSHFLTSRKGTDGNQIMMLDEKLDLFMVYSSDDLSYSSSTKRFTLPEDLYRLCEVYYITPTETVVVDYIDGKGSQYVLNSSKTAPNSTFPKYRRYGNNIEVMPEMETNTEIFTISDITQRDFILQDEHYATSVLSVTSERPVDGRIDITGSTLTTDANGISTVTLPATLLREFLVGDVVTIEYMYTSNVKLDYFKKPDSPVWNYVGTNTPIYNPIGSVDFEIHPSDQYVLVLKILELSGAEIKDPLVVQYANQEMQADAVNKKS